MSRSAVRRVLAMAAFAFLVAPAMAENEGLGDLDRATQEKVTAESLDDLNSVIDSIDTALEKGLDDANSEFAKQLLVSTLMQRAGALSAAVLNMSPQSSPRDPRWMQFRQFALNDLQRVVEIDPKSWEAYLLISRLQTLPFGDPGAARRALTKIVDAEDVSTEQRAQALGLRGMVQKEDEKRIADFDRAIELDDDNPEYLRLRAQYQFTKEEHEKALADVDKAIEMQGDHFASHELRGMILLGLDRHEEALESFNEATKLIPEAALPYQHRGELFMKQGDAEKALAELSKAIELAPESPQTLLVRAAVYYELKQPDKALADVEAAIRLQPQLVVGHLMRAEILAANDRLDDAIVALEELNKLAPDQAQLLNPLGTYYLLDGRPNKAIEIFSRVVELTPDDARALRFRGDAYLNLGQHREAIADFNRALEIDEDNDGVLNNLAWVLATSPDDEVRDGKRAVELATEANEIAGGKTPHILSTLAAAYAETGDFEKAKDWAKKAIEAQQEAIRLQEAALGESEDAAAKEQLTAALESLKKDLASLENELATYEQNKPMRERQTGEKESDAEPQADRAVSK